MFMRSRYFAINMGLCLGSLMASSVITQCECSETKCLSVNQVINQCNQISWRILANNKIVDADAKSWIKDDKKYGESIRNVIGEAIADCITNMEEFAGKGEGDVITFAGTTPSGYSPANWNAVVLWNYLHELKCRFEKDPAFLNENEVFKSLGTRLYNYYNAKKNNYNIDRLEAKINDAIKDIKAYSKALDLQNEMHDVFDVVNKVKDYGCDKFCQQIKEYDNKAYSEGYTGTLPCVAPMVRIYQADSLTKNGKIRGFSDISGNIRHFRDESLNITNLKITLYGDIYEADHLNIYKFGDNPTFKFESNYVLFKIKDKNNPSVMIHKQVGEHEIKSKLKKEVKRLFDDLLRI